MGGCKRIADGDSGGTGSRSPSKDARAGSMTPGKLVLVPMAAGFFRWKAISVQPELSQVGTTFVTFNELLEVGRQLGPLQIAAPPDLHGDILGDIARPSLSGVEAHDPQGVLVLARQEIGDDGFEVVGPHLGLTPAAAEVAEVVRHQIDGLIVGGDERG